MNYQNDGINMSGGNINAKQISVGKESQAIQYNTTDHDENNLFEVTKEIKNILTSLKSSYPTATTTEQMLVATRVVEQIESNPSLKQRVINAAREGGISALEKALDTPIGAFITGAIKGWLE
jgi:hypothetical protein